MRSKAAWGCFLAETQEFFPRVAAQHGYPGAAFSLADIGRAMQWLYHWLFPLAQPLPRADVAHIAMAGLCTLIATAMKLEFGTPFMLTEHGIYLRESYLAQAASLFGLFHKVFNLRFALRMTELSYQIADMISPCCDYNQRWELRKGAQPAQIRTIYYGVDSSVFTPTDRPPATTLWSAGWAGLIRSRIFLPCCAPRPSCSSLARKCVSGFSAVRRLGTKATTPNAWRCEPNWGWKRP